MTYCAMCGRKVKHAENYILDGKIICPTCSKYLNDIMTSNNNKAIRNASNYIHDCSMETSDDQVAEYLTGLLDNKNTTSKSSTAAQFCSILSILTWIVGLIIAIISSRVAQFDYSGSEYVFSFPLFASNIALYGIAGGVLYCFAELFENVHSIASSLNQLVKQSKEK